MVACDFSIAVSGYSRRAVLADSAPLEANPMTRLPTRFAVLALACATAVTVIVPPMNSFAQDAAAPAPAPAPAPSLSPFILHAFILRHFRRNLWRVQEFLDYGGGRF